MLLKSPPCFYLMSPDELSADDNFPDLAMAEIDNKKVSFFSMKAELIQHKNNRFNSACFCERRYISSYISTVIFLGGCNVDLHCDNRCTISLQKGQH